MGYRSCLRCVAVILLFASPAFPFCSVPQPRLVCAEYFRSPLVVKATLIQTKAFRDKDNPEGIAGYVYTMRVNQVIRGTKVRTLQVYEGNDSGRATFGWVPKRDYLLFLDYASDEKAWVLDGCGNSGPLTGAAPALSAINAIRTSGASMIRGVVSEEALSTPLAGVHVEAQSGPRLFAAVTNEQGEFQFNVPPGRYSVSAVETGRLFGEADISYQDLDYPLEPGGCAQVQIARH
jgi:hypothetical protein